MNTLLIRDWYTPAANRWKKTLYPGRQTVTLGCGWFSLVRLLFFVVKSWVWAAVLAGMFMLFICTAIFDLATYPARKRRA